MITIPFTTAVIIYVLLIAIPIILTLRVSLKYGNILEMSLHVDKETMFYFNDNPEITCIVAEILNERYKKPNVKLAVTYSDNSTSLLITPLTEFNKLWTECD